MHLSLPGRLALSVSVISLAVAAAAIGGTNVPAQAASASPQAATAQPNIPGGTLDGVAATSAASAWAVGEVGGSISIPVIKTLLLHWNGRTWARVTDPQPVDGQLQAVAAASADNAWAVGYTSNAKGNDVKSLIMRWNGKAWGRDTSAPQVPNGILDAVTATANGVWAVGATDLYNPLIMHRVDGRWYVVPTEGSEHGQLEGVAVTGARTAWAVGNYGPGQLYVMHPLLFRWNGAVWKSVSFPFQSANGFLYGIAAGPSGTAWAVGHALTGDTRRRSACDSMERPGRRSPSRFPLTGKVSSAPSLSFLVARRGRSGALPPRTATRPPGSAFAGRERRGPQSNSLTPCQRLQAHLPRMCGESGRCFPARRSCR
jgi:hypothetical protein